jgi:hypothetical protein
VTRDSKLGRKVEEMPENWEDPNPGFAIGICAMDEFGGRP